MFILQTIIFLALVTFVLFLPGYFLLRAIFSRIGNFSKLEEVIISFGLGLVAIDFIFFLFDFLKIKITVFSSVSGIAIFLLATAGIFFWNKKISGTKSESKEEPKTTKFSKQEMILLALLFLSIFFIKTVYLSGTIEPTSTDMGHHLYWAKEMADTGTLPRYEGMPDFIIGEHIVFGLFNIIGKVSFFGAFPVSLLYLFNLLSILTVFILTRRIFRNKKIAILSLFFLGLLFAVSSPQAKFVSGGVIGNILGNFLMPLALYFYIRAFEGIEKLKDGILRQAQDDKNKQKFLALAIFVTFGLFYTHHLTSFIFLFSLLGAIIIFLLFKAEEAKAILKNVWKLVFSWRVIATFILGLIFFFFIFTPNYASLSAVDTAVGEPVKSTRTGLSWANIFSMVGELRVILGILGALTLAWAWKKMTFARAVILGWTVMLFIMSMKPQWLFIDLPNSRVGNYLTYPLAILSAFLVFQVFFKKRVEKMKTIGELFFQASLAFILVALLLVGVYDSLASFKNQREDSQLSQVFDSSAYLAKTTTDDDLLLKDHNYITGDTWIKLFFMRGYRYPLSRSFFKRYEDPNNPREMCTLYMISNPASREAFDCYQETKTNLLMVNPLYDSSQFEKLNYFEKIYASQDIEVFYKNK